VTQTLVPPEANVIEEDAPFNWSPFGLIVNIPAPMLATQATHIGDCGVAGRVYVQFDAQLKTISLPVSAASAE
jgi:hypothetical protein